MTKSTSKYIRLTKAQTLQICQHAQEASQLTYNEFSEWSRVVLKLHIAPSKQTIGRTLRSGSTLLHLSADCLGSKKARSQHQLALGQGVAEFVRLCELEKLCVSGDMAMQRAKELVREVQIPPRFRPRFGWSRLRHLQVRYGVRWRRAFGESGSVDLKAAEPRLLQLRDIIHCYEPRNIYNMDESSFFYNQVPRGSLCFDEAPSLKQDKSNNGSVRERGRESQTTSSFPRKIHHPTLASTKTRRHPVRSNSKSLDDNRKVPGLAYWL